MNPDTTKEQPSPEVWEAQQQELGRLARLVEQLERMNQELRFAGEARAKQDREEYTIADVLTADKDALLKLATDENETLRARVAELTQYNTEKDERVRELVAVEKVLVAEVERLTAVVLESPHNAPSLPQEPPVPVSAGDSSSEYAGMPWEGRP